MPFSTSIQLLLGAHSPTGIGTTCTVDWQRNRAWLGDGGGTNLTRIGLISGLEEAYAPWSNYASANTSPVGIDANGNLYLPNGGLHSGGQTQIDGGSLAQLASNAYPTNDFGGGGFANVPAGGSQYMLDVGVGGGIIGPLSEINVTKDTINVYSSGWPVSQKLGLVCNSKPGNSFGFLLNSPSDGTTTQAITLSKLTVGLVPTLTVLGSLNATGIDSGWTTIVAQGMCIDQTDGNPLVDVTGSGGAHGEYIVKLNAADGTLLWKCPMTVTTGIDYQWNWSSVLGSTLYVVGGPPCTLTTINTTNGSSSTTTSGLSGVVIFTGQMSSYNLGTVVCHCTYTQGAGSPTPLNSTPSSWSAARWAVLYVAAAPTPPTGTGSFLAGCGPIRRLQS